MNPFEDNPTAALLFNEFKELDVPLTKVAEKYLKMNERTAKARATQQQLPFPVFRGGRSAKSALLVRVTDLADYLDRQHKEGVDTWNAVNDN